MDNPAAMFPLHEVVVLAKFHKYGATIVIFADSHILRLCVFLLLSPYNSFFSFSETEFSFSRLCGKLSELQTWVAEENRHATLKMMDEVKTSNRSTSWNFRNVVVSHFSHFSPSLVLPQSLPMKLHFSYCLISGFNNAKHDEDSFFYHMKNYNSSEVWNRCTDGKFLKIGPE